jgi:hypothetical protein
MKNPVMLAFRLDANSRSCRNSNTVDAQNLFLGERREDVKREDVK